MSSLHGVLNCFFLHLYLLFYGRGGRGHKIMSAILLLDGAWGDTNHRLPGSGSTVVTMTCKVNGKTEI